jgi:hypothetical protein
MEMVRRARISLIGARSGFGGASPSSEIRVSDRRGGRMRMSRHSDLLIRLRPVYGTEKRTHVPSARCCIGLNVVPLSPRHRVAHERTAARNLLRFATSRASRTTTAV